MSNPITENKADDESAPPQRISYCERGDNSYFHCGVAGQVTVDGKVEPGHRPKSKQPQSEQRTFGDPHGRLLRATNPQIRLTIYRPGHPRHSPIFDLN